MPTSEHAASRKKDERLDTRVSPETKALLEEAAAIQGRSVADFVLATAVDAANRAVREREYLDLSK